MARAGVFKYTRSVTGVTNCGGIIAVPCPEKALITNVAVRDLAGVGVEFSMWVTDKQPNPVGLCTADTGSSSSSSAAVNCQGDDANLDAGFSYGTPINNVTPIWNNQTGLADRYHEGAGWSFLSQDDVGKTRKHGCRAYIIVCPASGVQSYEVSLSGFMISPE